jgi:hypothetical protein
MVPKNRTIAGQVVHKNHALQDRTDEDGGSHVTALPTVIDE